MEPVEEVRVETKIDMEVSVHVSMHVTVCGAGKGRQRNMLTHMLKVINTLCLHRMEKIVNVMHFIVHTVCMCAVCCVLCGLYACLPVVVIMKHGVRLPWKY